MTITDDLYSELKPDIEAVAKPLFEFSEICVKKRGSFLPHGAVLTATGEIRLVAAIDDPSKESASAVEVLPLLHQGLRQTAKDEAIRAVGVAEDVTVTLQGRSPTRAIKVLLEHKRGLTVALYVPFEKKLLQGFVFGSMFSTAATPEVNAWD